MVKKLIGFNHHIGNSYAAVQMDVGTLLRMIDRGASASEMESVTSRLRKSIYQFPKSMTSVLEMADYIQDFNLTVCRIPGRNETLDLTRADEICSLYNWMQRTNRTFEEVIPFLS